MRMACFFDEVVEDILLAILMTNNLANLLWGMAGECDTAS